MLVNINSPREVAQALGERLRAQRLAQNLSQNEVAQMAGLSLGALRKLEQSGQSSLQSLLCAAQALGLLNEINDLFTLKRYSIAQMQAVYAADKRKRASRLNARLNAKQNMRQKPPQNP